SVTSINRAHNASAQIAEVAYLNTSAVSMFTRNIVHAQRFSELCVGPRSEERRGRGTRLHGHPTLRADQRTHVISDVRGECIQGIRIAPDCLCIQGAETCRHRKDDSPQWP